MTRAKLFDAAADLIGEQGLHATTVDQIVERAGVAKGTVYYHFKSKDELFQALLVEGLKRLADALRAEADTAASPAGALAGIVHAELENIQRYEAFARLMMSQVWRADSLWTRRSPGYAARRHLRHHPADHCDGPSRRRFSAVPGCRNGCPGDIRHGGHGGAGAGPLGRAFRAGAVHRRWPCAQLVDMTLAIVRA